MNNPKFWGTVVTAIILVGVNFIADYFKIEIAEELKWIVVTMIVGFVMRYSRNWITESNKDEVERLLKQIKKK